MCICRFHDLCSVFGHGKILSGFARHKEVGCWHFSLYLYSRGLYCRPFLFLYRNRYVFFNLISEHNFVNDTQGSGLLGCPYSISHGPKRFTFLFYLTNVLGSVFCARLVRSLQFIDITMVLVFCFFSCQCVYLLLHHGSYIIIEWPLILQ